ncbi:MAG: hypothetical protein IK130_04920 [Oscillospiraceae bacterium]|nr:hypothetical protein [Oscillospiraceae bacterium]
MGKDIWIDRWLIEPPQESPDENGERILICMKSVGPLEVWEWGIRDGNLPFMRYKWLENDFYEDDNRTEHLCMAELLEKIRFIANQLRLHDYPELAARYDALYDELEKE